MIQAIDNFLGELLKRLPGNKTTESEREKLRAALSLAARVHGERLRPTGESYLDHARAVAAGLNELGVDDTDTIVAALLHDALLPHTGLNEAMISAEFGPITTNLLRSAKTLDDYAQRASHNKTPADLGLEAQQDRRTLEALRRALLSIIEGDIRIILIRMVDCLQDLRRADKLDRDAQRRLAWEALHIYAPIANRLGIWHLKWQLEDNAFRYLEPERYREIALRLDDGGERRALKVRKAASRLRRRLSSLGLKAVVTGRPKHMYSIYRKMARKELDFDQIYDIQALRVILEPQDKATYGTLSTKAKDDVDRDLCYQVLGAVHSLWQPIRGEFDDYIGSPKPNGYMSLHTAVIDETGQKLEVQIRTERMHEDAEHGIAAHWAYKEQGARVTSSSQKRIQSLRELLATLQEVEDDPDSTAPLDIARLEERIHVFTPKDDVLDLPSGATPIDFAYQIHTEVGHRCRGARVNGKMVSLDYRLKSGDKVEIITIKRGGPNRDWMNPSLGYTGSARTRAKIRHWFRQQDREQNILQGREVVEREIRRLNLSEPCSVEQVAEAMKFDNLDDFLSLVGFGDITPTQLAGAIATRGGQARRSGLQDLQALLNLPGGQKGLTVRGVGGVHTRLAQCCTPVAPEAIIGYITRGQGITIHTQNCPQVKAITERERLIDVEWGVEERRTHPVPVVITADPRDGLIEDLVNVLRGQQIAVPKTKLTNDDELTKVYLLAEVTDLTQLNYLMTKLGNLPGVRDVRRQNWR
jgi:GTP pyrophosphokinase